MDWNVEICSPSKYLSNDSKIKVKSEAINTSLILNQIRTFSSLNFKRIGWNYPLDYLSVLDKYNKFFKPGMLVFDIGCGPSPLHKFIENKYSVQIVGIDINRWDTGDCVDFQGSMFLDESFTKKLIKKQGKPDLVISVSAFEHLNLKQHKKCINSIQDLGSIALITSCISSTRRRTITNNQINLGLDDLSNIYDVILPNFNNIAEIAEQYSVNPTLLGAYILRFGYPSKLRKCIDYTRGLLKYKTLGGIGSKFPDYLTFLAIFS